MSVDAGLECGPYVCPFPEAVPSRWRARWTCPVCGSRYRMTRRIPWHWWRNWCAPEGMWVLLWREQWRLRS